MEHGNGIERGRIPQLQKAAGTCLLETIAEQCSKCCLLLRLVNGGMKDKG